MGDAQGGMGQSPSRQILWACLEHISQAPETFGAPPLRAAFETRLFPVVSPKRDPKQYFFFFFAISFSSNSFLELF